MSPRHKHIHVHRHRHRHAWGHTDLAVWLHSTRLCLWFLHLLCPLAAGWCQSERSCWSHYSHTLLERIIAMIITITMSSKRIMIGWGCSSHQSADGFETISVLCTSIRQHANTERERERWERGGWWERERGGGAGEVRERERWLRLWFYLLRLLGAFMLALRL